MGLLRDGSLEECDVVFCDWPRYEHFRLLREERGLGFRLNQIPGATQQIHHKKSFTRNLKRRSYVLPTHLESCWRRLPGVWVEKPFDTDRGEGITFLRDPRRWRRKEHLLQRYLEDPWLVRDRKTEVRVFARIEDDGSVEVHPDALVRVAHLPFTLDDLDPLIHNSNFPFQERMGVKDIEQHVLSDLGSHPRLLDSLIEIVRDTVAMLRAKRRFGGGRDFETMGYDFVVDRGGTPYLLEANRFPGLHFGSGVGDRFFGRMVRTLYGDL